MPSPSGSGIVAGRQPLPAVPATAGHASAMSATPSPSPSGPASVRNDWLPLTGLPAEGVNRHVIVIGVSHSPGLSQANGA